MGSGSLRGSQHVEHEACKGGSYAYCDEDGNYYRSSFGLHY